MRPRCPSRILDLLYALPDQFVSYEDWQRLQHLDLPSMTPEARESERVRVILRLAYDRDPAPWLRDRLRRLGGARGARRGGA